MQYQAVKGMNDLYGFEALRFGRMEEDIKQILRTFGYTELRTPIVEELALFKRGVGETTDVVQKEMYQFEDKGGRMLVLRPEGTAAAARAFIERRMDLEFPAPHKLFYIGLFFRYERPQKGRYRQFHQLGLEVLGDSTPEMDAELIYTASRILEYFRVKSEIRINSIGCKECRPLYREKLIEFLKPKAETFCEDCKSRIEQNPLRVLDCKRDNLREKYPEIPKITEHLCECCKSDFERVKKALNIFGVSFVVDPFIVRGLDYYTKTAFEITAETGGSQNAIGGGGRYDNLIEDVGGISTPATGMAFGLERLLSVIAEDFYNKDIPVMVFTMFDGGVEELIKFTEKMTRQPFKFIADYSPKKMKAILRKANQFEARHVFIFGESELAEGRIIYKDMAKGEQILFRTEDIDAISHILMNKDSESVFGSSCSCCAGCGEKSPNE